MTVLVTTHFMDEAEYCDRIVSLIYRGRLLALGNSDELRVGRQGGLPSTLPPYYQQWKRPLSP